MKSCMERRVLFYRGESEGGSQRRIGNLIKKKRKERKNNNYRDYYIVPIIPYEDMEELQTLFIRVLYNFSKQTVSRTYFTLTLSITLYTLVEDVVVEEDGEEREQQLKV